MKKSKFSLAFLLLIITLIIPLTSSSQSLIQSQNDIEYGNSLIRVFSNGKVGYIDTTGKIIIEPKFANAYDFFEGLAPARVSGRFGFINTKGEFVVQPKYDYAEAFRNGRAVVFIDGNAGILYADKKEIIFDNYQLINFFNSTKAFVTTHSKKMGVIDYKGILICDTLYNYITEFKQGVARVEKWEFDTTYIEKDSYTKERTNGVIDSIGNVVVPLGKYKNIGDFTTGCFPVSWTDSNKVIHHGIINTLGEITAETKAKPGFYDCDTEFVSALNDSLFVMKYNKFIKIYNNDSSVSYSVKSHCGIFNKYTGVTIEDTTWQGCWVKNPDCIIVIKDINSFSKYALVNSKGKLIIDTAFYTRIQLPVYNENYFVLDNDNSSCIIDTKGKVLIPYGLGKIKEEIRWDDTVQYNIFTSAGTTVLNSRLKVITRNVKNTSYYMINENGTLKTYDSNYFYCFRNGKLIYKSELFDDIPAEADIDNMKQLDFNTGITYQNFSKEDKRRLKIYHYGLSLVIDKCEEEAYENPDNFYAKKYKGIPLYIVNTSDRSIKIGSSNFIRLKLQAKNKNGEWKYIESKLYGFICGNGVVEEYLSKDQYLKKIIPLFHGDFKTKLRAELIYFDKTDYGRLNYAYSNEVDAKINPAQFWRLLWDHRDFNPFQIW